METYECEICGKKTKFPTTAVKVEGAEFKACSDCAKLGTVVERRPASPAGKAYGTPASGKYASQSTGGFGGAPKPKPKNYFAGLDELVENYDTLIKKAREAKGLSHEDLALKIKEKAALIKKIERKEIHPEESVMKKLEKELGIKLTEAFDSSETFQSRSSGSATLGDVAFVKKK
ncbi:MAG: multiprotein bridging factor aMBF1 [Methanosarcinales archaeon]|jgi:putative transcription factor|nr:multiprotein bridging factor aMBF1 [Methanosarcinales archaeon]